MAESSLSTGGRADGCGAWQYWSVYRRDEKGRVYEFITNNFEIKREEVAYIYKLRWNIELLFKKLKQNFQLHFFYSETENGIKTQIMVYINCPITALGIKSKI